MKQDEFERVRSALFCTSSGKGGGDRKCGLVNQPDFKALLAEFPWIRYDTLVSIYSQDCVARVKQAYGIHRRQERLDEYGERWRQGESLVAISECLDFPPCSLARLLLPNLLGSAFVTGVPGRVTKIFNDPDCLQPLLEHQGGDSNKLLDSGSIPRLISDVKACIKRDHVSSPLVASVKRAVGLEYEAVLYQLLSSSGLAYETESDLRKKGATKTPDALLKIPFLLGDKVVNWIDSKACFCSEELYYNDGVKQFKQYVNRFGPGLVIYWFGYVEDIPFEEGVLISDSFPEQFTHL